jgi:hypothetical protein
VISTVLYCMDQISVKQSRDMVRQIAVPPTARVLSTLSQIDYADAFLVEAGAAQQWSAEQCARAFIDAAPLAVRVNLLLGWLAIGLRPAIGGSRQSILGWEIRASAPEFVVLGRDSLIGMPAELLFKREHGAVLFCTFVQRDSHVARAVWAAVEPTHRRVVRRLLEYAGRRFADPVTARERAPQGM